LARQKAQGVTWELVLVDNASTDDTADLACKLWTDLKAPVPLKIASEHQPGLSHARLRGVLEARYEAVGFVDDDNWLDAGWVRLAAQTMADNPQIGLLGSGNIKPVFQHPPPMWLHKFIGVLACGSMEGEELERLNAGGIVAGAGMVTRKAVFQEMNTHYGKFFSSDRKGSETSSGGDIEFAFVTSLLGWEIGKHPNLKMHHFIPDNRATPDYIQRLLISIGAASNLADPLRRAARAPRLFLSSCHLWPSYSRLMLLSLLFLGKDVVRYIFALKCTSPYPRMLLAARAAQVRHLARNYRNYSHRFEAVVDFVRRTADKAS
jgi:glycosyltransferase involved in cell wall biosynthesis